MHLKGKNSINARIIIIIIIIIENTKRYGLFTEQTCIVHFLIFYDELAFQKNSIYFSYFFLHDFIFLGQIKGQFNRID